MEEKEDEVGKVVSVTEVVSVCCSLRNKFMVMTVYPVGESTSGVHALPYNVGQSNYVINKGAINTVHGYHRYIKTITELNENSVESFQNIYLLHFSEY